MIYPSHIKDDSTVQTHKQHSEEVAALCGNWGRNFGLENTCYLIGLLHDMGKGTIIFRNYIEASHAKPHDKSQKGKIDHSTHGAKYIYERYGSCGDDYKQLAAEWIAMAILSHHGGLQNFISVDGQSDLLRRVLDKELPAFEESKTLFFAQILDEDSIACLFMDAVKEIQCLEEMLNAMFVNDKEYQFSCGMVVKLLFSILIDADRSNTAYFMTSVDPCRNWNTSLLWEKFAERLEAKLAMFAADTVIQQARRQIADECLQSGKRPPGIYELSVPTGSGKTFSSMRFALAHAKEYGKERIIICIPYTSIIDQNAGEIRAVFQNEEAILEHHSSVVEEADLEEAVKQNTGKEHHNTGNMKNAERDGGYHRAAEFRRSMTERWDTPVIFTTMVQLLNTLFAGGTRDIRRMHQLRNSVIVFDEIQTLPVKCTYLFNSAMNFLAKVCNTTIVLCTATQPTLEQLDHPIVKAAPSAITSNIELAFQVFQRTKIEDITIPGGYCPENAAALIWQDAVQRGNVLCIVNTTATANAIYQALKDLEAEQEEDMMLVHLSTKMCAAHRKQVLKDMREVLGQRRVICVSTQLVEAGVDISFTTVYRAVAALSSIAQAAGRCNRHGENPWGLVKIFNVQGERLDRLPDIAKGAEITVNMLAAGDTEPSRLLAPAVMQRFFLKYYGVQGSKAMGYQTKDNKETLYSLLADNPGGRSAKEARTGKIDMLNYFAFRDAGREFTVIDTQTFGMLAPYGVGKELCLDFNSNVYQQQHIYQKLKQAQQYMVNLFSYEVKALLDQKAIYELAIGGVWALQEEYYNKELGVVIDSQKNQSAIV